MNPLEESLLGRNGSGNCTDPCVYTLFLVGTMCCENSDVMSALTCDVPGPLQPSHAAERSICWLRHGNRRGKYMAGGSGLGQQLALF